MKEVSTEELINHKILPYNIYSEFGEKLFAAGEVLTPGKLLQLKHIEVLYRDEDPKDKKQSELFDVEEKPKQKAIPENEKPKEVIREVVKEVETPKEDQRVIIEVFDMKPSSIARNKFSVDDIDISNYKGPINKKAKIDPQTQLKIKAFYNKILEMINKKPPLEMLGMFANIRDKIMQDIILGEDDIHLSSQLKLLGEHNKCHALNTAILSGFVAKTMSLPENSIYDIVLAGLLHDIGKCKIPQDLLTRTTLSNQELAKVQEHTRIGYEIIRLKMQLPEHIARVALEHHEYNDGSGYPNGKSGDRISTESKIIHVCNFFDNLTSNRTHHQIRNTRDALRVLLEIGTQKFSADALYTFIHMFSYNDTLNFEEMVM